MPERVRRLPEKQDTDGKKGGTLTVLNASDFENIDPAVTYYQFDYMVHYATQRAALLLQAERALNPSPDLAEAPAEIGDGGRTLTIKLQHRRAGSARR